MRTLRTIFALLSATAASMPAVAQNAEPQDSVASHKEVKNRNVMLNAESADQPRQISIGLPSSLSANIFEDGLPVSYSSWPDLPFFSWFGGVSNSRVSVMSISETALQYGTVGYTVDSYNRHAGKEFQGVVNYQLNHFGRQVIDANISGPIAKGWGYTLSSHQIMDPGSYDMDAARLHNRSQNYKVGINKLLPGDRGSLSLLYQYSRCTNTTSDVGPFVFVGDGSVKKYNGFDLGTDAYYPVDGTQITYMDVMDGKLKTRSWKDLSTVDNHQLTFTFDYKWDNSMKLNVASKYKDGDVNYFNSTPSGIVDNDNQTYFLKDGTLFEGDKVQNRYAMYDKGFERDWLTTATLTGLSKDRDHSWRMGLNFWWNRAGI